MKLMRVGEFGQEKPAILDENGIIRDLSAHVSDIDGNLFSTGGVNTIAALDLASLPAVDANVRVGPVISKVGKFITFAMQFMFGNALILI